MATEKIISTYLKQREKFESLTQDAKDAQVQMRETLQNLLDAGGKGPHSIGGKNMRIMNRKGILCLMPSDRPKVTRKKKEKKAEAAD